VCIWVYAVAEDLNSNIWVGTTSGVASFNGSTWTFHKEVLTTHNNSVRSIVVDQIGNIWVVTVNDLYRYDGIKWVRYNSSNSDLPSKYVWSVFIDNDNCKWICTDGGLVKLSGNTWTVYNTSNSGLPTNYIHSISIDNSGNKWIGTYGNGLVKFDDHTWTVYNISNTGFSETTILSIFIDDNGNKWLGTYNGLFVFNENGVNLTDIQKHAIQQPEFSLLQNYPNPFNSSTIIKFLLTKAAAVTLKIFNTLGQEVTELVSREMNAGAYSIEWNTERLASGIYFYHLRAGNYFETKKMVLLR